MSTKSVYSGKACIIQIWCPDEKAAVSELTHHVKTRLISPVEFGPMVVFDGTKKKRSKKATSLRYAAVREHLAESASYPLKFVAKNGLFEIWVSGVDVNDGGQSSDYIIEAMQKLGFTIDTSTN